MNRVDKINFYICNAVVAGGVVFCILYLWLRFPIKLAVTPCYMHDLLHLYCFGCGGTRAVRAFLNLDFIESFLSNPLVLYGVGIFLYYYIGEWLRYFSHPWKKHFRYRKWLVTLSMVMLLGVFTVRNVLLLFWQIDYLGDLVRFWKK